MHLIALPSQLNMRRPVSYTLQYYLISFSHSNMLRQTRNLVLGFKAGSGFWCQSRSLILCWILAETSQMHQ